MLWKRNLPAMLVESQPGSQDRLSISSREDPGNKVDLICSSHLAHRPEIEQLKYGKSPSLCYGILFSYYFYRSE